jgi:hypothetical protein
VFLGKLRKGIPICKVAHSIRQSYLYTKGMNAHVYQIISTQYPLSYCYIPKGDATSFYYNKNNLISYYIHSTTTSHFDLVPLYSYVKNDYEIILSPLKYDFRYHHEVCAVRAPNGQLYMSKGAALVNVSKGTTLYNISDSVTYLFHSMPIANSFFL